MKKNLSIEGLGGRAILEGEVAVSGAKNDALKAVASAILFEDGLRIENAPKVSDVLLMNSVMRDIGFAVKEDWSGKSIEIRPADKIVSELPEGVSKKMRASVVATGPLLARFGKVVFPAPGGCVIGARPVDAFITGYEKMGARTEFRDGKYFVSADGGLKGGEIFFDFQTVGGTETLMMSAVLAKGRTVLKNCAMEPEIANLASFLNKCGAKIKGAGTTTIEIEGGGLLKSGQFSYKVMPDRIEAGSFLILGAGLGKNVELVDADLSSMEAVISLLEKTGADISVKAGRIVVRRGEKILPADVRTHEYPGFPTDLQPQISAYLSQAEGESRILETIFENRFKYAEELVKLGADITIANPREVIIRGGKKFTAGEEGLKAHDIRAGFAVIIGALFAEGRSVIEDTEQVERGYENLPGKLRALGAGIEEISVC